MADLDLANKRIHLWLFHTGNSDINIHDLSHTELEKVSKALGQAIQELSGTRWVALPRARDKSKVTFFEGGEE